MSEMVNAILYEVHIAVLMPDERPIKHVVLESPSEKGMQGDLSWRYYMPESYTATLANENAKLRELLKAVLQCVGETKRDKGCDACPMYNGPWRSDGTWCLLRPTLRELGIEVQP